VYNKGVETKNIYGARNPQIKKPERLDTTALRDEEGVYAKYDKKSNVKHF